MFRRERHFLTALAKENAEESHIVRFFEAFKDRTQYFLVFEELEMSLYQLQYENDFRPMAVRDIRTITLQILRALKKLDDVGIIHADIKPVNIMTVNQQRYPYRVKLIDFGSSVAKSEITKLWSPYIQTICYRAPEILLGLPFCEKVDIWSVGCVIAEQYLGYVLYPAKSELDLAHYIFECWGIPPSSIIESAMKGALFFDKIMDTTGEYQWTLRPRVSAQGTGPVKGSRKSKHQVAASLKKLGLVEDPTLDLQGGAAEITDRLCMVDLLKRMFSLDRQQRISASHALHHPFVTLQHLSPSSCYQQYYEFSLQGYKGAHISAPPSLNGQHFPSEDSVESQEHLEKPSILVFDSSVEESTSSSNYSIRAKQRSSMEVLLSSVQSEMSSCRNVPDHTQNTDPINRASNQEENTGCTSKHTNVEPEVSSTESESRTLDIVSDQTEETPQKKKASLKTSLRSMFTRFGGFCHKKLRKTRDSRELSETMVKNGMTKRRMRHTDEASLDNVKNESSSEELSLANVWKQSTINGMNPKPRTGNSEDGAGVSHCAGSSSERLVSSRQSESNSLETAPDQTQETPKKKKGPLRRMLTSLFSCFGTSQRHKQDA
ncbi:hypothetical protein JZ751_012480 [Albula glossodonta]|uniref:Protein kinase domain-containing protein n=1 Tax=Albula glossodonta TaxID=121402 RepID=A0A8T2NV33_9TELE|nr:hypothetical protein JZ751_012480 [Albula glossodonta]